MRFTRKGSQRDHGPSSIEFNPTHVWWEATSESINLYASYVSDFNTDSQHDWTVKVTLSDLRLMVDAAASAIGGSNSENVGREMSTALTSLMRLATEASREMVPRTP